MVSALISGKIFLVFRFRRFRRSGKVFRNGKKDLLAALHRAWRGDGAPSPVVVEPGAHLAAARLLLVGRLSQRMGLAESVGFTALPLSLRIDGYFAQADVAQF